MPTFFLAFLLLLTLKEAFIAIQYTEPENQVFQTENCHIPSLITEDLNNKDHVITMSITDINVSHALI